MHFKRAKEENNRYGDAPTLPLTYVCTYIIVLVFFKGLLGNMGPEYLLASINLQ